MIHLIDLCVGESVPDVDFHGNILNYIHGRSLDEKRLHWSFPKKKDSLMYQDCGRTFTEMRDEENEIKNDGRLILPDFLLHTYLCPEIIL